MGELLHRQPFKCLYLAYFSIVLAVLKIPFWFVYYARRANRPRSSWTAGRTVMVRIFRELIVLPRKTGVRAGRDLSHEVPQSDLRRLHSRFMWIEGLEDNEVVGEIRGFALHAGVQPIRVPGYWLLKSGFDWLPEHERASNQEKTILHLHGGAFVVGSAHPSNPTTNITRGILKHSRTVSRSFAVDYRLSSSVPFVTEHPFPAAILDAIAAYKYLVCTAGFLPHNITVVGDSAGGNLAIALTRYLLENSIPHLPPPGALVLLSPWADLSTSRASPTSSYMLNSSSDILNFPAGILQFGVTSYLGVLESQHTSKNRYISPASVHVQTDSDGTIFNNFPRTYIVAGGAELIYDDILALYTKMVSDGVDVQGDFPPDAIHNFLMFTWHEDERTEALQRVCDWLDA